jgi:dienelactone hydrolase
VIARRAALLFLLLAAAPVAAKADAEAKLKTRLAKVWIDYARWCKAKELKQPAEEALALAKECDPDAKDLARLEGEVAALSGDKADDPGLAKRRTKANKDAAKVYDKLAKLDHKPEDASRFEGYLFTALELDPSKARIGKVVSLVKKLAGNRQKAAQAGSLLTKLREADPKGNYDSLEAELARKDVVLIKSPDHALVGYLSLPKGWKKGKREWPVLVTVDGAGSNFLGAARNFAKSRGSRNFIVLAPCTFANTNEISGKRYPFYSPEIIEEGKRSRIGFDVAGLLALLEVVKERYGGADRIGITGFSGGGNLTYCFTMLHPDRVLFAAPACGNFNAGMARGAEPIEGGGPPIHILTGANDPHRDWTHGNKNMPGIEPQTDTAEAKLKELGFTNVRRTMLPGVKHSSCARQVYEFADEVMSR